MKKLTEVDGRPVYGIESRKEIMRILKGDVTASLIESNIGAGYSVATAEATYIVPTGIAHDIIKSGAVMLRYVVYGVSPMAVAVGDVLGKRPDKKL